jgi:DNA topoisomerase-2
MAKLVEEKFKKLDEISHVLLRPGRYLGAINPHTAETYVVDQQANKMVSREVTWIPALIKIFDEVISNSVDFSKTTEGKHVSKIKVDIDKATGTITVFDDGGIIVHKHKEYDQWIPEMIFELRAGSNFNDEDDSTLTGQNGEGAALTSIFSKEFRVKTADGTNQFDQTHYENSRKKTEPKIKLSANHFTEITFTPDYEKFGITGLDDDNYAKLVKRVYDVAGCNPRLKVYLNNQLIKIKDFEDYVSMYTNEFVYEANENWKVAIAPSANGFQHVSFVNTTETQIGGGHINYIRDQIIIKLREYFKKKHKTDIRPSDISNHFMLFIDATINKPRYSSQTKDEMITEIKAFGTTIELSDKFIRKILGSPIVQSVLDWIAAKEDAERRAKERQLNKTAKSDPKNVEKFVDATTKKRSEAILFLTEGDSASGGIKNARDSKTMGLFPLRGKPINAYEVDIKRLLENEEFANILKITGLQIGVKVTSIDDLRFGKIVFMSDQDVDGFSIRGLLIAMFYRFWPELFDLGVICIFNTPLAKVKFGKQTLVFYSMGDLEVWRQKNADKSFVTKYYKGLGTSNLTEWKEYLASDSLLTNMHFVVKKTQADEEVLKLLFSKERGMTDRRKEWLNIEETV